MTRRLADSKALHGDICRLEPQGHGAGVGPRSGEMMGDKLRLTVGEAWVLLGKEFCHASVQGAPLAQKQ